MEKLKVIVRTDSAGEAKEDGPKHVFFYLPSTVGTERTTMNSLVPFRSVPQRRVVKVRHALIPNRSSSTHACMSNTKTANAVLVA